MTGARTAGGHWLWSDGTDRVAVRFVGRGPLADRGAVARDAAGTDRPVAWGRQIHSARVLRAAAGSCGAGDALVGAVADLALSVATADCVPLLIGSAREVAAVHAGWRGIVGGVVPATLAHLRSAGAELTAWLGPAIGSCCYEVGADVAERVAAASDPRVVVDGAGRRPHLDLPAAVAAQLHRAGVEAVRRVEDCTHCRSDRLWSYRRHGPGAGRNYSFVWLREALGESG